MTSSGATISPEEFQRMQTQLLDLRTANYTLMEESNKLKIELRNAIARCENNEKELQKALRTVEKSRKAKDVEMLFAENEALQCKLLSQEEEFRLQNQTLLSELSLLVKTNEKLESALKTREAAEFEARESLSQGTQCDLLTEGYEEKLGIVRTENRELQEEVSRKNNDVEMLKSENLCIQSSLNQEISILKQELELVKVEADKATELVAQLEKFRKIESELLGEIKGLQRKHEEDLSKVHAEVQKSREEHQNQIETLKMDWMEKEKQHEIQLELMSAQRAEFEEEAARCKQEAQDALEDARIAERRIATVTQDLRRQLRAERRRADKLQERLRDLISDGSGTPVGGRNEQSSVDGDNCSVSSWSLMSGQNESHSNGTAPTSTPDHQRVRHDSPGSSSNANDHDLNAPVDLVAENSRLVARLAQIQQEKWRLEERVSHLEESNAAMADEMVRRGQLIQFYCMEQRPNVVRQEHGSSPLPSEKLSVRRMVSLIRQIGHDSSSIGETDPADVQKRLQLMLEETLTKNMHLTEDLERLSQEVVRLSQMVGSAQMNGNSKTIAASSDSS